MGRTAAGCKLLAYMRTSALIYHDALSTVATINTSSQVLALWGSSAKDKAAGADVSLRTPDR